MEIYWHKKADTNEIFYVGQAVGKYRAYSSKNRNTHWHNVVNAHGLIVEIVANNLSKEKADLLEKFLIKEFGRIDLGTGRLVNMTEGGEGISTQNRKLWWSTRTPEQLNAIKLQRSNTFKEIHSRRTAEQKADLIKKQQSSRSHEDMVSARRKRTETMRSNGKTYRRTRRKFPMTPAAIALRELRAKKTDI